MTAEKKLLKKLPAKEHDVKASDPRTLVVAAMTADAGYLAYIIRTCIETQALMEHFSYVFGIV